MENKLIIGLIGLGTVGSGVVKTLKNFPEIEIKSAAVKNLNKKRDVEVKELTDDPYKIVNDPQINAVVEVAGGVDPAFDLLKTAIKNKKHIVTANKELLAKHGAELFDLANKHGKLLVGTGDLSELAMGWCTYNGDHMSMYGVNASVPKTLVRYLVDYVASVSEKDTADVLYDILDTPVSPELLPPDENGNIAQKTEENIGPYELHDFFLYNFIRFGSSKEKLIRLALKAFDEKYSDDTVEKWADVFIKRFFISQFKRSCVPDSPKVGSVSLSPRGDWRMPSDASFAAFIK